VRRKTLDEDITWHATPYSQCCRDSDCDS